MNEHQIETYHHIASIAGQYARAFAYTAAGIAALIIAITWN